MQSTLQKTHLGGHDQLMIHYVVWGVAHSKEGAGGVQVAGHPCADIHVLPYSLGKTQQASTSGKHCSFGQLPCSFLVLTQACGGSPDLQNCTMRKEELCPFSVSGQEGATAPTGSP